MTDVRVGWATRAAASLTVMGAGLVVAAVHGSGAQGHGDQPVAAAAVTVADAPQTYRPPQGTLAPPAPAAVSVHAAATRRPATHASPSRPRVAVRQATPARHRVVRRATTTFRQALMAAVARIPTYRSGAARWVVSRAYDFWGTADWYHDVLYVSPDVPRSKLYDVAVHEWSHELSVLDYGGDVSAATRAMNAWFGGSGLTGPERAADCMAVLQGATWTHYTTCTDAHWRAGAKLLVSGHPL